MAARKTKKQQYEEAAIHEFFEVFSRLKDPRRPQGKRYPLVTVVLSALMAMVCGADDAEAMSMWSDAHEDWLSRFLPMPHGSPSQDVYLAVFASLDPIEFAEVFTAWVELLRSRLRGEATHIAIDGKTSRRSYGAEEGATPLHTVSAWTSDVGLVLAQRYTDEKSNEITAVPELLKLLDLRGATITIDAMGCQRSIARDIVRRDGDYLLAVKQNQGTLYDDIDRAFTDALDTSSRAQDMPDALAVESFESVGKGHGRVETRKTYLCRDLSWLTTEKRWEGLSAIAMTEATRECVKSGKTERNRRYYIASSPTISAARVAHLIRRHWGIENEVHWVLDVAFREDDARHRAGNCAANMGVLRKIAVNLLKADTTKKVGIANKRKMASWDRNYLLSVLTGPD